MAREFTAKFQDAYRKVVDIAHAEGEFRGRLAFRNAMLELGKEERILNLYRVQDKLSKSPVFFNLNPAQRDFMSSRSNRNIILKSRQVGITTYKCVELLDNALWVPNSKSGIMCHKLHVVKSIFNDITKFCYDWFVKDWGHLYSPTRLKDSSNMIEFDEDGLGNKMNSSIMVMHDFRGKTIHSLHVSEASRIESSRLIGSLNGVPDNGDIDLESTANGRAGEFHRIWQTARTKSKTTPYKAFFIPWFRLYPEKLEDWNFPEECLWSSREQELLSSHPEITKAHLLWRRYCIEAKCGGNEDAFEVEYPSNDIDCFSTNDSAVFSHQIIKSQDKHVRDPAFVGHLTSDNNKMELHEDPKGVVAIWERPNPSHTYAIGADPSGGVGRDMGAAYVKDQTTKKIVARLWGDLIPADFAQELYKLANYYNKAWMCVEANNHGLVVLYVLAGLGYRNMYKRRALDEVTQNPTTKIGFLTNNQNKLLITEKLKTACRDKTLIIQDSNLLAEMSAFVQISSKNGSGMRRQATADAHDDLVMAASLMEEMDSSRSAESMSVGYESTFGYGSETQYDPDTGFAIGAKR